MFNILDNNNYTANDLYNKNEEGKGGFFPIGKNNCWHGGIHIPTSCRNVLTLLPGKLAAYAIYDNYATVPLPEEISNERYQALIKDDKKDEADCYEVVESRVLVPI